MVRWLRLAAAITLLVALVVGTGTVAADSDSHSGHHGRKILDTRLVGLAVKGQVLLGVTGAGRPWTLENGRAKLHADGWLDLKVHGLLLGPGGTNEGTNPVTLGRAIVVCNGVAIVMSDTVPFSPAGDARVKAQLVLPSPCLAPVVFFGNAAGAWFAVSG
jgi:hypothetical protein